MSVEGQGHFFTIYFPGFVCFVLYLAKISGERLQDHWSSGIYFCWKCEKKKDISVFGSVGDIKIRYTKFCCCYFFKEFYKKFLGYIMLLYTLRVL